MRVENTCSELTNIGMSTVMTHQAYGRNSDKALKAVRKESKRLEELLSRYKQGSEISNINRLAGQGCVKVGKDTYQVLISALKYSEFSQGLFDITIGPLVSLWNIGRDAMVPPELTEIEPILPLIDYTGLVLDQSNHTARLARKGQTIDLGGIGKGFAADKFIEIMKRYEIASAYTNIGGNVATIGAKPDGTPWRIGIQHPRLEKGLVGVLSVTNKSVVTSGDYQRYFIDRLGKRYHHILDPRTGYPAESEVISVTVVTDQSMEADALSTLLLIAGISKGRTILNFFKDAQVIFIDRSMRVFLTEGLKNSFQPMDDIDVTIL